MRIAEVYSMGTFILFMSFALDSGVSKSTVERNDVTLTGLKPLEVLYQGGKLNDIR